LVAVALVQASLSDEIETSIAEGAPAYFFLDIQPAQLDGFEGLVRAIPGSRLTQVPMLRGRSRSSTAFRRRCAGRADARWALRSDRGLTYMATLPAGSQIVSGDWWPADYHGPPLISFDAALAKGMGLKIGDTLTVNVLGREITATIASLRRIDWTRLGVNFAIVFAPGTVSTPRRTPCSRRPGCQRAPRRTSSARLSNTTPTSRRSRCATRWTRCSGSSPRSARRSGSRRW